MHRWALVMIAALCVAPALAGVPVVPTPPAGSLPVMKSRTRPLPSAVLTAEVIDHLGLRHVLDQGGYVGGREREFFGKTATFNHVTQQVLRFGDGAGATRYLRWLRKHAAESLGAPQSITKARTGRNGFVYRPKGCGCPSETPTYLLAWQRGTLALTVLASGSGASPRTAGILARKLDRAVS